MHTCFLRRFIVRIAHDFAPTETGKRVREAVWRMPINDGTAFQQLTLSRRGYSAMYVDSAIILMRDNKLTIMILGRTASVSCHALCKPRTRIVLHLASLDVTSLPLLRTSLSFYSGAVSGARYACEPSTCTWPSIKNQLEGQSLVQIAPLISHLYRSLQCIACCGDSHSKRWPSLAPCVH